MIFDDNTLPARILSNPTKVSLAVITAMESALKGDTTIPDVNNGMVIQLGAATGIFASIAQELDTNYSYYYSKRAQTPEQLYPKLSQYDYINLTAGPASMPFVFVMQKEWITDNAISYDDNYNILIIPKTSYFTVGTIKFGMYYPIIIYVNKTTGVITAVYDTTTDNPLYTLSSNMLYAPLKEYTQDGINKVALTFEMFQFERLSTSETVTLNEGFNKTFSYNDQFYAVRVFSVDTSGNSTELVISLAEMYYDTTTPTAIVTINNVNNVVTVKIPQIYFDNGSISTKIVVDVYDTKGSINYTIPLTDAANVIANFDVTSTMYAAPFSKMGIYSLYAVSSILTGGSDAMTYAEMKTAIVNGELYDRIPISAAELTAAASKYGYSITRYVDSLTDRIFFASNLMKDSDGDIIPVISSSILLAGESLTGNPSTILPQTDGSVTILPTTIFTLGTSSDVCVPLDDSAVAQLVAMTTSDRITALNNTLHLRQPFHICLSTDQTSPSSRTYNLMNPTYTDLTFIRENIHSSPQMSITTAALQSLENGTGGFLLRVAVTMTSNMLAVDPSNIRLVLATASKSDAQYTIDATYVSTTESGMIFDINFGTNYLIDIDDYINVIMTNTNGSLSWALLPLTTTFDVRLMVSSSVFPTIAQDPVLTTSMTFSANDYLQIARQSITVEFGKNLSEQIYSAVDTSWSGTSYKTYTADVPSVVSSNVYQRSETGSLETHVNSDGTLSDLIILYAIGDDYLNESMISTTLHTQATAGDAIVTVTDATGILVGMPVVIASQTTAISVKEISGTSITLSAGLDTTQIAGTAISFDTARVSVRTSADQSAVGPTLPVSNTTGIYVGMSAYGYNIPSGATVSAVEDNVSVTLSINTTTVVTASTLVTFINKTAPAIIAHHKGDVVLDVDGNPTVTQNSANQYRIPAILFDGRLYDSDDVTDTTAAAALSSELVAAAAGTTNIRMNLAEQQQVFYRPQRTIGYATYNVGDGNTKYLPLALSFNVILTVPSSVYTDSATRSVLSTKTIASITSSIQATIISTATIATNIATALGASVTGVNVGGINNDSSLVIISLADTDAKPSLEGILYEKSDGTIGREPNVTISFIESPDGT